MSSEWQPARTPLFGVALTPPPASGTSNDLLQQGAALSAPAGGGQHVCHSESCGWQAVAVSPKEPVAIAVAAEEDAALWPMRWLHPAERQLLERMTPRQRRQALAVLTAARRALVQAFAMPEPAAAVLDLSPLLDGVQALRLGNWTLQRVPAPAGCYMFVAAPGAGWSYYLLPHTAEPCAGEQP